MKIAKSDRWCFTLHVSDASFDSAYSALLELKRLHPFIVFGLEKHPYSQNYHFQGYIETLNVLSLFSVKRMIPVAHVEVAISDRKSNLKYCTKDLFFEHT